MRFSVVTVCYNAAGVLEQTMESVLGQTYADVEYIVVDGGSTDGSADIISRYSGRLAWWCSEPDGGIYDAMNKGLARCTGRYVCFMNAGDRFASPTVLAQVAALHPTATVLYGNTLLTNGEVIKCCVSPGPLEKMKRRGVICHQSALISVEYHKKNLYDTNLRALADFKFFRHAYLEREAFAYVPIAISCFDTSDGVSKNMDLHYKELGVILNKTGLVGKLELWLRKVFSKLFR